MDIKEKIAAANEEAVRRLTAGDPERVLSSLGKSVFMFNGNYSTDVGRWQAHLFLDGENLSAWPEQMIEQAGPWENRFEVVSRHVRGDSAVVVTRETGRNRFREWKDEEVVYLLGRTADSWRIVGLFIRDAANPE